MHKHLQTLARIFVVVSLALGASCAVSTQAPARSPADQAREAGPTSTDPELVGRWLIAELISPGSNARRARDARKRLDDLGGKGLYASLARGLDDELHGHPGKAAAALVDVLRAAQESRDANAPFAAWYASNRLLRLQDSTPGLWSRARPLVEALIRDPGAIGWRARGELVEWWTSEAYREGRNDVLDAQAREHGCRAEVRLAGPFGRGLSTDPDRAFAPERPGAWPARFAGDPLRPGTVPQVLATEHEGCTVRPKDAADAGVYYAETFLDLTREEDVLVAVQGARAVLVDDVTVLERKTTDWAVWPTFGALVHLGRGRHRIVARIGTWWTSIRLLRRDGTPLVAATTTDPGSAYETAAPRKLEDPNILNRFLRQGDVVPAGDDVTTFLAAYLAHVEGQDDLADVLLEPLVKDVKSAAPLSLASQAQYVGDDPIFPTADSRDISRELYRALLKKDPDVWRARHWLIADEAQNKGHAAVARSLRDLATQYPEVPQIGLQLAAIYAQLGWKAEHTATVTELAQRFPENTDVLYAYVSVLENTGQLEQADKVVATIRRLDRDSELDIDRALRGREYAKAIAELERLGKQRPDRKDIADRIADVMRRAGTTRESFDQLERAVAKEPTSTSARLALADARFATGDHAALRTAIAEAIQAGGKTDELVSALELVEGRTELEPYRVDARKVIEAYEKTGAQMDAPAVRILDYGVTWVHHDGSARTLEHEIIRVQSQEAITKLAEQRIPDGLLLRARVLKKDGQMLEPEFVANKPTLTMPHLEVGDYIETESITTTASDGQGGSSFLGPHWFFREADIAYWRSEFVVISPKDRPLSIETWGQVPAPEVNQQGFLTVRRWVVDKSPAAVVEPGTVPVRELLPSVRVSWGVDLRTRLRELTESLANRTVADPRLRRIAQRIVHGIPADQRDERARRLYRWILANVEPGDERDGRRIVVGKSGDLAFCFLYLARLIGIPTEVAVVRNRLAQDPAGPASEAENYDAFVVRIETEKGDRWLTVRDKFTPFGYLPAEIRGQPGFMLSDGNAPVTTSASGSFDGVVFEGTAELRPTGAATLDLSRMFVGKYAIVLRSSLESVPEAQLRDAVEQHVLGSDLPGASLVAVDVKDRDDLDKPVALAMKIEMPDFARRQDGALVLSPPFGPTLSNMTTLPERKTTMLIGEASRIEIRLRISLPEGARILSRIEPAEYRDGDRLVRINDRLEGRVLVLDRIFDIPASRVHPDEYARLKAFARTVDDAVHRDIRIAIR